MPRAPAHAQTADEYDVAARRLNALDGWARATRTGKDPLTHPSTRGAKQPP